MVHLIKTQDDIYHWHNGKQASAKFKEFLPVWWAPLTATAAPTTTTSTSASLKPLDWTSFSATTTTTTTTTNHWCLTGTDQLDVHGATWQTNVTEFRLMEIQIFVYNINTGKKVNLLLEFFKIHKRWKINKLRHIFLIKTFWINSDVHVKFAKYFF